MSGIIFWALNSQINGAVIASGRIIVEQNREIVQHISGGKIAKVHVREGSVVLEGSPLLVLEDAQTRSELRLTEQRYLEVLAALTRLRTLAKGSDRLEFPPEMRRLTSAETVMRAEKMFWQAQRDARRATHMQQKQLRTQLSGQIAGMDALFVTLQEQRDLVGLDLEDRLSLLNRGLSQAGTVRALQREDARLKGAMAELAARKRNTEDQIRALDLDIVRTRAGDREKLLSRIRSLENEATRHAEALRALQATRAALTLRAPVTGIVHDMRFQTAGAVVRPAEPLLDIVPMHRPRIVVVEVPPKDVIHLFLGQNVRLKLPTLHADQQPRLEGRLRRISADVLRDNLSGQSYYRVEIGLDPEVLAQSDPPIILLPGMAVEVFITLDARTPFAFLVQPLARYLDRAFRES